jgi:hypothetical protein
MKVLFALLLSVIFLQVNAQQRFEGRIVYRITAKQGAGRDDSSSLTVFFGKNKLRINYERAGLGSIGQVIVDLDSGRIHELDTGNRTFVTKGLFKRVIPAEAGSHIKIAGYAVTATDFVGKGIATLVSSLNQGQVLIYPAPDLYYPIPEEYISDRSVSMVYDNKILLGITIIDRPRYEDHQQDTIHIVAESVLPAVQPASIFSIPEDFSPEVQAVIEPPAPVEIEAVPDTVTTPPPPMLSPEPVSAPAKTIKKRSTTTKSPMRKPGKRN